MNQEITRVREQGTVVTQTSDNMEKINAIRSIVTGRQYAKVNGIMVDLFSASAIIAVYDALNEVNKEKFAGMPVGKMATVAFKLVH